MLEFESIDEITRALYLEIPAAKVVLFQAYFETYEGMATVRTLNVEQSRVVVLTTRDQTAECAALLESLREHLQWRVIARPPEADTALRSSDN